MNNFFVNLGLFLLFQTPDKLENLNFENIIVQKNNWRSYYFTDVYLK